MYEKKDRRSVRIVEVVDRQVFVELIEATTNNSYVLRKELIREVNKGLSEGVEVVYQETPNREVLYLISPNILTNPSGLTQQQLVDTIVTALSLDNGIATVSSTDTSLLTVAYNPLTKDWELTPIASAINREDFIVEVTDRTSAITTGTSKTTIYMPFAMTITSLFAYVTTAPTGDDIIIDINEAGASIFSTELQIDNGDLTSLTSATPYVLTDTSLAQYAKIDFDLDQVGSSTAGIGVSVVISGYRT